MSPGWYYEARLSELELVEQSQRILVSEYDGIRPHKPFYVYSIVGLIPYLSSRNFGGLHGH